MDILCGGCHHSVVWHHHHFFPSKYANAGQVFNRGGKGRSCCTDEAGCSWGKQQIQRGIGAVLVGVGPQGGAQLEYTPAELEFLCHYHADLQFLTFLTHNYCQSRIQQRHRTAFHGSSQHVRLYYGDFRHFYV